MKKTPIALVLFIVITLIYSCKSVDKSRPEEVLNAYLKYKIANDAKSCYDLISTKSKEIATFDEFKKVQDAEYDSGKATIVITGVQEQEKDMNYPTYRRFKVIYSAIHKADSIKTIRYYTLINENNHWEIVWSETLSSIAWEKYQNSDYEGAITLVNRIIDLNPFNGDAFEQLAWCYSRLYDVNNTITSQEFLDKAATNSKKAISLEPDITQHYNAMSGYYTLIHNEDLAIEYLQKALALSKNKRDSVVYLSNIAVDQIQINNLRAAEVNLIKAIDIDPYNDFTLYNLGRVMNDLGHYNVALQCFERVSKDTKLEDHLKGAYYYDYAITLRNVKDKAKAKEYILKALEISPTDTEYKAFYESLK